MTEDREAQSLALWLEKHPGQALPPDIDPDVAEAVYALRPDLAPAPKLSIDDIFAAVESGPFAESDPAEAITEEVETASDTEDVVYLADERAKRVVPEPPANKTIAPVRRVPWWAVPGAGALAAAALALVVIVPTAGILLTQKSANLEMASPTAAPAPKPDATPATPPPIAEATPAPMVDHAEDAPPAQPARERISSAEVGANELRDGEKADHDDTRRQEPEKTPARADGLLQKEEAFSTLGAEASGAAGFAAPAPSSAAAPMDDRAADKKANVEEQAAAPAEIEMSKTEAKRKSSADELERDAGKDAESDMPAAGASVANIAEATPTTTQPAAYAGISAGTAEAVLVAALDSTDDRKAMTAAWFLADRQLRRGQRDQAAATISKALGRAGQDDLRSDLAVLQWKATSATPNAAAPVTEQQ